MSKSIGYGCRLLVSNGDGADGVRASKEVGSGVSGFLLRAQRIGADGNNITITLTDPLANNQSLSVSVSGTNIEVSLATDAVGNITSRAKHVIEALNDFGGSSVLVQALPNAIGSGGTLTAFAQSNLEGGALSTNTYDEIGDLKDFNYGSGQTASIDATTADSPDSTTEQIAGLQQAGTLDFVVAFDAAKDSARKLEAFKRSRTVKAWRFILSDDDSTTFDFKGFVSELTLGAPLTDLVTRNCQIALSGLLIENYGS